MSVIIASWGHGLSTDMLAASNVHHCEFPLMALPDEVLQGGIYTASTVDESTRRVRFQFPESPTTRICRFSEISMVEQTGLEKTAILANA